ncbi:MAG TPA: hypothetical protein VLG67_01890 [Candidatus Saccharimonadales bacterium]|nr:hypothetical protein [Candidatus Saccharimonadales bacterium]
MVNLGERNAYRSVLPESILPSYATNSRSFRSETRSGLSRGLAHKLQEISVNYDDRTELVDLRVPQKHMIQHASEWLYGYRKNPAAIRDLYLGLTPAIRKDLFEVFEQAIAGGLTTIGQIRAADKTDLKALVSSQTGKFALDDRQARFLKQAFGSFPIDV